MEKSKKGGRVAESSAEAEKAVDFAGRSRYLLAGDDGFPAAEGRGFVWPVKSRGKEKKCSATTTDS